MEGFIMYMKQLSVFIENREGRLQEVLDVLKKSNVNIVKIKVNVDMKKK